jgi:hypothetical protein
MGIGKVVLLAEALVLFAIVAGFVVQEFMHHLTRITGGSQAVGESQWSDLLRTFVALFGSGSLYGGLAAWLGWK